MRTKTISLISALVFAVCGAGLAPTTLSRQDQKPPAVCRASALRALQPLPKLNYKCRAGTNDYDVEILKWPERLQALKSLTSHLQTLSNASWWQTKVDDLNACTFKKRVGKLTATENEKFRNDYFINLLGDNNTRLVVVSDPCFQTGYGGSVIFLLLRNGNAVSVTKLIDGYFSRVENSIGFDTADLKDERIIEIETGNSMPPSLVNYYFSIDPKTHQVKPRNLIKEESKFTNEIYSDMLMSAPSELDLADDAVELKVIQNHKLSPTFSTYMEDSEGKIESVGKRFTRTIYRWNGRYYEKAQ